jgi:deoxyhypusine synthase
MARTPTDAVAALLRRTSLSTVVRAQAWDAFQQASTPQELTQKLKRLPLPQAVRGDLWDLKAKQTARKDSQMLPRESKYGRGGAVLPDTQPKSETVQGSVSAFIDKHFKHYNAGSLRDAAEAYASLIASGGQMVLAMAGALSTGEIGISLAEMIRQKKIHAISCSPASMEESMFLLCGQAHSIDIPDYHERTRDDDKKLADQHTPRVTDVTISERHGMKVVEDALVPLWQRDQQQGIRRYPFEYLYELLNSEALKADYTGDPEECWMLEAAKANLPLYTCGWSDSTLGQVYTALALKGEIADPALMKSDIEALMQFARWYVRTSTDHPVGFLEAGGGAAADWSICVVPMLKQDYGREQTPFWALWIQCTVGIESVGSYSGASGQEKITWSKTSPDTPMFTVFGDCTISLPLLFAYVLGQ